MYMKIRASIIVTGRVQGVFFRDFTRENAIKLGLTGWVRNLPNGSVESMVEGEKDDILKLIEHLKQGPSVASVKGVKVNWQKYIGKGTDFSIQY